MFTHSIYLGGDRSQMGTAIQTAQVISGNEVHPPAGTNGTALVVHGNHSGTLIENNRLLFDLGQPQAGGWGIALRPGYGGQGMGERNANTIVRGNTVVNAGNLGIEVDVCQNCLIENNLVVNTQQFTVGIAVPEQVFGTADAMAATNVTVRNNTTYLTASGSIGLRDRR